jgi:hypothetical protein
VQTYEKLLDYATKLSEKTGLFLPYRSPLPKSSLVFEKTTLFFLKTSVVLSKSRHPPEKPFI